MQVCSLAAHTTPYPHQPTLGPCTPHHTPTSPPRPLHTTPLPPQPTSGPSTPQQPPPAHFTHLLQAFDRYRDLWDCLDDIDANARVLEPSAPRRSDVARRLALGPHAFLRLLLDLEQPYGAPAECQFLGSAGVVGPMEERFFGGLEGWDPSR